MKALQVVEPGKLQQVTVPVPELGPEQVLVRFGKAVICGSDVPKFNGTGRGRAYPLPPGMPIHECVGYVERTTSARFSKGDTVVAIPLAHQGLSECFAADAAECILVPHSIADSDSSLLIQPLSTVIYALDRLGDITGLSVSIVGLGPIGLLTTWLCRKRGAGYIVGIDPIGHRCNVAVQLGADETFPVSSGELLNSGEAKHTWEPSAICVEAVGHQTATFNDCLQLVQHGGTVLALGVPEEDVYPFEYVRFFRKNLQLIASVTPPWHVYLARAAGLVANHADELALMITHRYGIRDAQAAFSAYAHPSDHNSLKILLDGSSW